MLFQAADSQWEAPVRLPQVFGRCFDGCFCDRRLYKVSFRKQHNGVPHYGVRYGNLKERMNARMDAGGGSVQDPAWGVASFDAC